MKLTELEYFPGIGRLQVWLTMSDGRLHTYSYREGDIASDEELPFIIAVLKVATKNEMCPIHKVVFNIVSGAIVSDKLKITELNLQGQCAEVQAFAQSITEFSDAQSGGSVAELLSLAAEKDEADTLETQIVTKEVVTTKIINGKAVVTKTLVEKESPVFDHFPMVDIDGNPILSAPEPMRDKDGNHLKELVTVATNEKPATYKYRFHPAEQEMFAKRRKKKGKKVSQKNKNRLALLRGRVESFTTMQQQPTIIRNPNN